jgi:fibronectin-binding autotransporter adhesin
LSGTGQLFVSYNETIGNLGTGTFIQSGGTNTTPDLYIGGGADGGNGTYTLSGGLLSVTNLEILASATIGAFLQSGGTNSVQGGLCLTSPYITDGTGTYQLNGGMLVTSSILGGAGTPIFEFGGGTLEASGSLTARVPMTLTGTGGNATVDTNGNAVALSGVISGPGGLNKLGTNTLTLTAVDTYTGPTTISGGTLALGSTGSLASSSIGVAAGATYDVSAVVGGYSLGAGQTLAGGGTVKGNTVVDAGGILSPGNAPGAVGTLTFSGNLFVVSGTVFDFELASPSASDLISLPSSTLTLNGQQFSDFVFLPAAGFQTGTYTLIDAASIQGGLGADLSGTIDGDAASISISGGNLLLTVVPEPSTIAILLAGAACLLGCAVWRAFLLFDRRTNR